MKNWKKQKSISHVRRYRIEKHTALQFYLLLTVRTWKTGLDKPQTWSSPSWNQAHEASLLFFSSTTDSRYRIGNDDGSGSAKKPRRNLSLLVFLFLEAWIKSQLFIRFATRFDAFHSLLGMGFVALGTLDQPQRFEKVISTVTCDVEQTNNAPSFSIEAQYHCPFRSWERKLIDRCHDKVGGSSVPWSTVIIVKDRAVIPRQARRTITIMRKLTFILFHTRHQQLWSRMVP